MVKKELAALLAKKARLTKRGAAQVVDVLVGEIIKSMNRGEKVLISGFGTFKVVVVQDKSITVPGTGERKVIKAHRVPRFIPGRPLKEAVK